MYLGKDQQCTVCGITAQVYGCMLTNITMTNHTATIDSISGQNYRIPTYTSLDIEAHLVPLCLEHTGGYDLIVTSPEAVALLDARLHLPIVRQSNKRAVDNLG